MHKTLSTRKAIYDAAISLARRLNATYIDKKGKPFTDMVFSTLNEFCKIEFGLDPSKDCSHRGHEGGREEFLWDYIAQTADTGLILVAESEQSAYNEKLERLLRHDFEKLLYAYAPIRLLVCKSKNKEHSNRLISELQGYANDCCLNFNPGAVLLVHLQLWEVDQLQKSQSYIWQNEGEPCEMRALQMSFQQVQ